MKIFAVFGLILMLNRLRLHLHLSILLGALVLGLWMGVGPDLLFKSALMSVRRPQTISLLLIVGLILVMSRIMKQSGHLDRLVRSFARLSKDSRMVGSVMSALIGLLPMPGGALFSAPMVETSLCEHSVTGEQKTALNYWFRHIWEYWWPLYPGVVLAIGLLEVDTWFYMAVMAPMTLVSIMAGAVFILRPLGRMEGYERGSVSLRGIREFLWEIMPILIVILVIMALALLIGVLGLLGLGIRTPAPLSFLLGLMASIIWVCLINHFSFRRFCLAVLDKRILPMLLLIVAIMIFKGMMQDSQAVIHIRNELMAYRIPVMLIVLLMPFLSGLITGISVGFVGTSFPLIIPMFQTTHSFDYMSYGALAYTFGFMGMMLSPVHPCFLLTKDYFKAGMLSSYRQLLKPALTVMVTAVALFSLTRVF